MLSCMGFDQPCHDICLYDIKNKETHVTDDYDPEIERAAAT